MHISERNQIVILSIYMMIFDYLGYTLFKKVFYGPDNYNMIITYAFLFIQTLINIAYCVVLIAFVSFKKDSEVL